MPQTQFPVTPELPSAEDQPAAARASPASSPDRAAAFAAAQNAQTRALTSQRRQRKRREAAEKKRALALAASEPASGARIAEATAQSPSCRPPATPTAAQQRGMHTESVALRLIEEAGLHCLARNLWCPLGEIDLVARDGDELVFIEVRARQAARFGGAAGSVGMAKQRRLIRAAQWFLPALARRGFQGRTPHCRFDVIAFEGDHVHWLRSAFTR
ncbi:MAG: YraN family protein [Achromobacter sp.]